MHCSSTLSLVSQNKAGTGVYLSAICTHTHPFVRCALTRTQRCCWGAQSGEARCAARWMPASVFCDSHSDHTLACCQGGSGHLRPVFWDEPLLAGVGMHAGVCLSRIRSVQRHVPIAGKGGAVVVQDDLDHPAACESIHSVC